MNKSLRRRVAAVATTATVGGLLLPFLAAGSAFALATPTGLTASPSNAATNVNSSATFTVKELTNVGANNVYVQGLSGPDASVLPVICGNAATNTCIFPTGSTPGTDVVRFFYSVSGSGVFTTGDPFTTSNLTVAGAINQIVLTPAPSSVASFDYKKFSVTATDAAGRPVKTFAGSLKVTATETTTRNADLLVSPTDPGVAYDSGTYVASAATASKTIFLGNSSDGTGASVAGVTSFYVASRSPGTVNLTVSVVATPAISTNGALTVNPGTMNDITAVSVVPSAQRAFTTEKVSAVVNLRNAQGDPVAGITPVIAVIGGPNSGATVTPVGSATSDAKGNVTVSYVAASATPGTDTLDAFVNQNKVGQVSTLGRDSGEPFFDAPVFLVANDVQRIVDDGGATGFSVPLNVKATTITYEVKSSGNTRAGYNVLFASSDPKFTLSATSAATDAAGKVKVTVTNANPSDADFTTVTASVGNGVPTISETDPVRVTYSASAVANQKIKIAPFANTTVAGGTASFTVSATDQFGSPISGLTFNWTVSGRNNSGNNAGASGTGSTFSYSDKVLTNAPGTDVVAVQASNGVGGSVVGFGTANQYWVTTAAVTRQANIDLVGSNAFPGTPNGDYIQNNAGLPAGQNGPVQPSSFDTTVTTNVTPDPTAIKPVVNSPQFVAVKLADEANNRLYGKTVTFSSNGVGVFTDFQGNPLGTSATAVVADGTAAAAANDVNFKGDRIGSVDGFATVYVRSTVPGKQLITATVDGVSTNATVTYAGQYVGITPTRVVDTRTGQGALQVSGGSAATPGPLAPNTVYNFNYSASGMKLDAAAYAFNITAINPSGVGNLRVFTPASATVPTTSLVNYQPGKDVANFVIVPNSNGSNVLNLFSAAATANVAIDLVGYYPQPVAGASAGIATVVPSRIADTRIAGGGGAVAAGGTRVFQVAGNGSIPASGTVKTVALNVTAVSPGGLGNLRVFADGDALPTTSNINYIPGQDKSAFVIVNLPTNGKIDVYSAGTAVDVAIDAYAYYDQGSTVVTQTPVRVLDTRPGNTLATDQILDLPVAGLAGVPATASAVLVSITAIHTTGSLGSGNLAAFPSGAAVPLISTLNYVSPTSDVANFAIVPIGANGKISLDTAGSPTDIAVDVVGYVPSGS